ncbi:hypothetical protein [Aestuariispira insulae]|uniref:Uncharacterized protein n=1 Tax=Aestuariispira insulae TaxID=1461337 RepID=A0A3D9H2G2_9PROT|nr:hypothetical protein [Aestuariispira insulae]RED43693.1 hypothetical protein DFP90_1214 [Aestuariispira insulae]
MIIDASAWPPHCRLVTRTENGGYEAVLRLEVLPNGQISVPDDAIFVPRDPAGAPEKEDVFLAGGGPDPDTVQEEADRWVSSIYIKESDIPDGALVLENRGRAGWTVADQLVQTGNGYIELAQGSVLLCPDFDEGGHQLVFCDQIKCSGMEEQSSFAASELIQDIEVNR